MDIGWVLDPLTAIMLMMVTFVSMLIFIFSVGYMAHDQNFMRFFCFLALFASGMLGVVIANSLFLFFVSWEIVGLTSYLLIGFWYHKTERGGGGEEGLYHHADRRPRPACSAWSGSLRANPARSISTRPSMLGCLESAALN